MRRRSFKETGIMVKRLFEEDSEEWTREANQFANEIRKAIEPIIQKWVSKGYSIRELAYIAMTEADYTSIKALVFKKIKKKKNNATT